MDNVYTGIELGTDSVKIIVAEKINDNTINSWCYYVNFS